MLKHNAREKMFFLYVLFAPTIYNATGGNNDMEIPLQTVCGDDY